MYVLDYERAIEVIKSASHISVGICYYRHKMRHLDRARLNRETCLGCGLCVRACPDGSILLRSRPARVITPLNGMHRAVVMAIERGQFQDLIFDNRVMWSHRAMAAVLGVILKLPPVKQVLANRQVKSRFLEALVTRFPV